MRRRRGRRIAPIRMAPERGHSCPQQRTTCRGNPIGTAARHGAFCFWLSHCPLLRTGSAPGGRWTTVMLWSITPGMSAATDTREVGVGVRLPCGRKRQRAGALHDLADVGWHLCVAPASWSAGALYRFCGGFAACSREAACTGDMAADRQRARGTLDDSGSQWGSEPRTSNPERCRAP